MRRVWLIFAILVALTATGLCAGDGKPVLSDARIASNLKTKMAKSKVSGDHFTFSVKNGDVTIEGTTGVMQHKGVMTRMARTSGAVSVHNNIKVSEDAKAKAAAGLQHGGIPKATVTPAGSSAVITQKK